MFTFPYFDSTAVIKLFSAWSESHKILWFFWWAQSLFLSSAVEAPYIRIIIIIKTKWETYSSIFKNVHEQNQLFIHSNLESQ
jgi:hypothetical protein